MPATMKSIGTFGWWVTDGVIPTPAAVTISSADGITQTAIRVNFSWVANATNIYIERSSDGITYSQVANKTSGNYYDDTVTAGQTWYYRARAKNNDDVYGSYGAVVAGTSRISNQFERDLWSTFKTKMEADTFLTSYITTWKWTKEAIIISDAKCPLVKGWITDIQDEWIGVPKRKYFLMNIELHGLVKVKDPDDLETEKLKMSEYLKNALEADLEFAGGSTINYVGFSPFRNLDNTTAEISVGVQLMSKIFTAGQR